MGNVLKLEDFKAVQNQLRGGPMMDRIEGRSLSKDQRNGGRMRMTTARGGADEITLTEDQQRALDAMLEFERDPTRPIFVLSGAAGTGKTTVMQHYLRATERQVVLTAPTNKAVRVLADMASEYGLAVPCCTIHKLLGLVLRSDAQERYCERVMDTIPVFDVLVVDECSMVGNRSMESPRGVVPGLFTQLLEQVEAWGKRYNRRIKIIFVGDPCQLPPVKEGKLSVTFNAGEGVFLSQVVRQALDNPIIRFATYVRGQMEGTSPQRPALEDDGFTGVYMVPNPMEFDDLITTAYLDEPDHPTLYKALAFRNATVDRINRKVRRELYGPKAPKWMEGERYVATQPVVEWIFTGEYRNGRKVWKPKIWASTDEDAVLQQITETKVPGFERYDALLLEMHSLDATFPAVVPAPEHEGQWRADLEEAKKKALAKPRYWAAYWELHDAFAHFKPHYAMTCHRSQGSTYENVFVDVGDVMSNPSGHWEAIRCLYTASTRASKMLYLLE